LDLWQPSFNSINTEGYTRKYLNCPEPIKK